MHFGEINPFIYDDSKFIFRYMLFKSTVKESYFWKNQTTYWAELGKKY